jgi:hypothetical protein
MAEDNATDFEALAAKQQRQGYLSDLWGFLLATGKWWLVPVLLVLLLLGALMVLSASAAAPFLYTLF